MRRLNASHLLHASSESRTPELTTRPEPCCRGSRGLAISLSTALLAAVGCSGSQGASTVTPPPAKAQRILFVRANPQGADDLHVAAFDGSAAPRSLTKHVLGEEIEPHLRDAQGFDRVHSGRAIIDVHHNDVTNLIAVDVEGERAPIALTSFTRGNQIVARALHGGSHVVVRAQVNGIENLWVTPLDASAPLTNLSGINRDSDILTWDDRHLTRAGHAVFMVSDSATRTSAVWAARLTGDQARRPLGRIGNDTTVVHIDGDDVYMVETRADSGFSLLRQNTATGEPPVVLADPQPPLMFAPREDIANILSLGDHVVYEVFAPGSRLRNLMSVRKDGADRLVPKNLSGLGTAVELRAIAQAPVLGRIVYSTRSVGGAPTDEVYSVKPGDPSSRVQVSVPTNIPGSAISAIEVLGGLALFARSPARWATVRLDTAASERRLEDISPALAGYVFQGAVVDDVFARPIARVTTSLVFSTTSGTLPGSITDFWSVRANADDLLFTQLSATQVSDGARRADLKRAEDRDVHSPAPLAFVGGRVLVQRGVQLFSLDPTKERDERPASTNTEAITSLRFGLRGEAPGRVFYVANNQLFVSDLVRDMSVDPDAVVNVTRFVAGEQIVSIEAFTTDRVLLAVRVAGTRALFSAAISPDPQQVPVNVSRPLDTDDAFYLAF